MADALPLLEYTEIGSITIGTIVNTAVLDGSNVDAFGQEAIAYAEPRTGLHILIDFENVRYISSAALTELLRLYHLLLKTDGSVRLCNVNHDIHNVFRITNLEKLFVIYTDESTDLAAQNFRQMLADESDTDTPAVPDASD
jgi:anti-sigma B factor antagonist